MAFMSRVRHTLLKGTANHRFLGRAQIGEESAGAGTPSAGRRPSILIFYADEKLTITVVMCSLLTAFFMAINSSFEYTNCWLLTPGSNPGIGGKRSVGFSGAYMLLFFYFCLNWHRRQTFSFLKLELQNLYSPVRIWMAPLETLWVNASGDIGGVDFFAIWRLKTFILIFGHFRHNTCGKWFDILPAG